MTDSDDIEASPVKRALLEVRRLRERLERTEARANEPIAIVGLGCRFPGAIESPEGFWSLLEAGGDAIGEIPADRFDVDAYYDQDPDAPGKISTRWGGFLRGIDTFDPEFFNISAREAASLDPQQRLLLEVAWEALENAGIPPSTLLGTPTGVFAGIAAFDYPQLELQRLAANEIDAYFATGACHSVAAGRISYFLGAKGPSMALDTACSASLVAVHLACQSLRLGECNLALAGGVSLLLLPEMFVDFSSAHMMAADGRCKVFDAAADGYVRSEGCGMVALKRLSDAVASGDTVLAVIRGSAMNHDGRSNGLTAPNGPSQAAVIRAALQQARARPEQVSYVEAHGTGTSLGDPIEVQALAEVFAEGRPANRPLMIGSVKGNLGHLEAAAGIAGLIKTVLCLRHRRLPASLHFRVPNPRVAWERMPVAVVAQPRDWEPIDGERIAGVSSFGFSGTNAHVIVSEAKAQTEEPAELDRPRHVMTVSARSSAALKASCERFAAALRGPLAGRFADAAYSANAGRTHFAHRAAVVAATADEAAAQLEALAQGKPSTAALGTADASNARVCFLFSGQGSQYAGMGRELFVGAPAFRDAVHRCAAILRPALGRDLVDVLYGDAAEQLLKSTRFAQPAIVAVEYALTELWREWGIRPAAVAGHSLGEYAAAIAAGVLTPEQGLALVAERARLIEELCAEGRMAAVRGSAAAVRAALDEARSPVVLAALNGPESVVVSGSAADVEKAITLLEHRGLRAQQLDTQRAFHSPLLDPVLAKLTAFAQTLDHRAPEVPFVSNRLGAFFGEGRGPTAEYWAQQARDPVRFHDGLVAMKQHGFDVFLEIGPSATLVGLARESVASDADADRRWQASLRRGRSDWEQLLGAVAALHVAGAPIEWGAFDRPYGRRRVALPTYPFQRKRHWFTSSAVREQHAGAPLQKESADQRLWRDAVAAARRQAALAPLELDLPSYADRWSALEAMTTSYVVRTLHELRAFRPGAETTRADVVRDAGILPIYESLVERWLERLARRGVLTRHGERFSAAGGFEAGDVAALERRAAELFPDAPYVVDYLRRCGGLLTAILTGKESPLETLFPGGSRQTAVDLYRNWAMSRYCNDIVASVLAAMAAALPSAERMDVLEIGAGTGGTTAGVLPQLPLERSSYWFTDVSEFFFRAASEDFAAYPFVKYGVLDIGRSPAEQGYGSGSFHAVIAANVLHATADLRETIDHVLSLLRPGGALVLYEVTEPPAWIDTSVALIAGWAKSADGLRDDGPLLSSETWRDLLVERGFSEAIVFPEAGSPARILGMSVIVARAPAASGRHAAVPVALEPEQKIVTQPEAAASGAKVLAEISEALPQERLDVLIGFVRAHVAAVLRRSAEDEAIGRRRNLMELGIDSLMAIELRDRLSSGLALEKPLPASLIFDYPNIEAIAGYLRGLLGFDSDDLDDRPAPAHEAGGAEEKERALEGLSDDEITAMLLKKLERSSLQ